jgi:hypothetical protein
MPTVITILIRGALTSHLTASIAALALTLAAAVAITVSARNHEEPRSRRGCRTATSARVPPQRKIAIWKPGILVSPIFSTRWNHDTERRVDHVKLDDSAIAFALRSIQDGQLHLIANTRRLSGPAEYRDEELRHRDINPALAACPILFLEIDAITLPGSAASVHVRGVNTDGFMVLRTNGPTVADTLAAVTLQLRDTTAARPHLYFTWSDGSRLAHLLRSTLLERTAGRTRMTIEQADKDVAHRPVVHIDG